MSDILDRRLTDLAGKTNSRLAELRTRVTNLEQSTNARVAVGPVPPSNPSVDDLWVDTNP